MLDPYDVYQHLMDYWDETMQDDVYMVAGSGRKEAVKPRLIVVDKDKDKKTKEKADLVIGKQKYKTELVAPSLIIRCCFAAEAKAIEQLEANRDDIQRQLDELQEEHCAENGVLESICEEGKKLKHPDVLGVITQLEDLVIAECLPEDHKTISDARSVFATARERVRVLEELNRQSLDTLRTNHGKLIPAHVRKTLNALNDDDVDKQRILNEYLEAIKHLAATNLVLIKSRADALTKLVKVERTQAEVQSVQDLAIAREYLQLLDEEKKLSGKIKKAQDQLYAAVLKKYFQLSEAEIKVLVVDDKWLAALAAAVQSELERVSQTLTGRVKQLAERYATPLPKLNAEVAALEAKVNAHLAKMGISY